MEKEKKRNGRKFIIIEMLLLLIIIGSLIILFIYKDKRKDLNKENNYINKTVSDKTNIYNDKEKELNDLVDKIKSYDNIDLEISKEKEEYFKAIKKLEDKILSGESDKKIAYLTFDDGPYYNTYKVFDILDKYNVKATFFLTNINGEKCFDRKSENCYALYKEYAKRGHTIANHTYNHAIFKGLYSSPSIFIDAVKKQHEHIKTQSGGYVANILRFPGGIPTAKAKLGTNGYVTATNELKKLGYGWVDWTAENGDGKDVQSKEKAWNMLTSMLDEKIEVILFHDYNTVTTSLLPEAIEYLQKKGYILLPLFYESNMVNK